MKQPTANSTPRLVKRQLKHHVRAERIAAMPGQMPLGVYPYWMVWTGRRSQMPKFRHPNEEAARAEAGRLAHQHPGQQFLVARIEDVIRVDTLTVETMCAETAALDKKAVPVGDAGL